MLVSIDQARRHYAAAQGQPPGSPERVRLAALVQRAEPGVLNAMVLAFEQFSAYDFPAGHAALAEALDADPGFLPARWLAMQYPPAMPFADDAEIERFRATWAAGLEYFEAIDWVSPQARAHVWGCIGSHTAFYRHYLGDSPVEEMRRYGALCTRMMAALDPGMPPRPMRSGRRRVAVVSAHLREHTVARLFVPLVERLDPARFDVHVLDLDPRDDDWNRRVQRTGSVHRGPRHAVAWRRLLGELAPDVILHTDVGMHPLGQGLAALRLAPVQAMLWGHPVTTGLPTIDWTLSPDAFEPEHGERDYTERLLRLPGLGHGLEAAAEVARAPRREAGGIEILCAQSIYKLLPAQDALFARVLAALPGSRLHFVPHPDLAVGARLRERMRPACAALGVDVDARVVVHALLPHAAFLALAASCDFGLDSIGWSGGMTALDLLPRGLPTVTWPGRTMRSRQTAGLLALAGVPDLVAADDDAYVAIASRLGADADFRRDCSARLVAAAPRLADTTAAHTALADFLATVEPAA
jgi:predicted O-linked N-acetylglucosamine transferase (SPINDLY family)